MMLSNLSNRHIPYATRYVAIYQILGEIMSKIVLKEATLNDLETAEALDLTHKIIRWQQSALDILSNYPFPSGLSIPQIQTTCGIIKGIKVKDLLDDIPNVISANGRYKIGYKKV